MHQNEKNTKLTSIYQIGHVIEVGKKFKKKNSLCFCFGSRHFLKPIIISFVISNHRSCLDVVKVNPPRKPSRDPRRLASNSRSAVSPGTRSLSFFYHASSSSSSNNNNNNNRCWIGPLHFQKMNPLRLFDDTSGWWWWWCVIFDRSFADA